MSTTAADPEGQVIGGRYELRAVIGRGGHGIVCRARDRETDELVAVKMLHVAAARDPDLAERLVREQKALRALEGTSAVRVLDTCESDSGALCLVMELLDGTDFEAHLAGLESQRQKMSIEQLVAVLSPIVETLEQAHKAGIVHRDIKPANIFLCAQPGEVRLLDFGLARLRAASPLTAVGTVMGSPSYIAPEVWRGKPDAIDRRADVFSLAVIVFRALGGRLPFVANTLQEKFVASTQAERPSLHVLRRELPKDVDLWVRQALAIDPEERFQSVRALWNALRGLLADSPSAQEAQPARNTMDSVADEAMAAAQSLVDAAKPKALAAWRRATSAMRKWVPAELSAALPDASESSGPPKTEPSAKIQTPAQPKPPITAEPSVEATPPARPERARPDAPTEVAKSPEPKTLFMSSGTDPSKFGDAEVDDRRSFVTEWLAGSELSTDDSSEQPAPGGDDDEPTPPPEDTPDWLVDPPKAVELESSPLEESDEQEPEWLVEEPREIEIDDSIPNHRQEQEVPGWVLDMEPSMPPGEERALTPPEPETPQGKASKKKSKTKKKSAKRPKKKKGAKPQKATKKKRAKTNPAKKKSTKKNATKKKRAKKKSAKPKEP